MRHHFSRRGVTSAFFFLGLVVGKEEEERDITIPRGQSVIRVVRSMPAGLLIAEPIALGSRHWPSRGDDDGGSFVIPSDDCCCGLATEPGHPSKDLDLTNANATACHFITSTELMSSSQGTIYCPPWRAATYAARQCRPGRDVSPAAFLCFSRQGFQPLGLATHHASCRWPLLV